MSHGGGDTHETCHDAKVRDRYAYEALEAFEFERLVQALASHEAGTAGTVVRTSHTKLENRLDARGAVDWLRVVLAQYELTIARSATRGARTCLLATNYTITGRQDDATSAALRRLLAERAERWGLESLRVWWRSDVDARLATAPLPVRLEFLRILPADEQYTTVELSKVLTESGHHRTVDLSGIGLTWVPDEVTRLTHLRHLDLSGNHLADLPATIGRLTSLKSLVLGHNRLTTLPPEIGELTDLEVLHLPHNALREVPPEIGRLGNLKELHLRDNRLTALPPEVGDLTRLEYLGLENNELTDLPSRTAGLTELVVLDLHNNRLAVVPPVVTALTSLHTLQLQGNELSELPPELGNLVHLRVLVLEDNRIAVLPGALGRLVEEGLIVKLDNNPLAEPLPEVIARGATALATYLGSLDGAVTQYEAKVLLVGEGNVGKTSLVAAILDAPFVENRPTTHGIEIRSLTMRHPDGHADMTVRTWDFGGQEVYRITHQFFFSHRALYLVVWNARQGHEQDEVEGWLRRIRLRVGPGVRTLVVATHCDERRPELDYPHLRQTFPHMLRGHFDIDSRTRTGIAELRTAVAEQVARLPHMGQLLNRRWIGARDEVLDLAEDEPQIAHNEFVTICRRHQLTDDEITTLAELLHDLGQIVYYGDDDGLRDTVVLNPEWLTKAIGYVLEDEPTRAAGGVLDHARLATIWRDTPDGFSYPPRFHPFFLRLMEKFDVSYRLEDGRHSLVAQLVGHDRPELPWDFDTPLPDGVRSLAFTCQLSEPAPGLMAWLTVRHHRATTGKHWRRGVFLRHPIAAYASEALLRLRTDRELFVEVRAPSPDMFFNVLRDSAEDLLRRRWPGLTYQLSIPCPARQRDGTPCTGRFPLDGLLRFRESGGIGHTCLQCVQTHDVPQLLTGFSLPSPDLQPALERLEHQVTGVAEGVDRLARFAADAAGSLNRVLKAIASEVKDCPRLFTLAAEEAKGWQRLRFGHRGYRLVLWCEHPGAWHAWPGATYRVQQPREWLVRVGPYANLVFKALRLVVPIAKDVAGLALGEEQFKQAQQELDLMRTLVEKLPGEGVGTRDLDARPAVTSVLTPAEGDALRALRVLLFSLDQTRGFGGLRRVHEPSGDFLWVCADHYRHYDPGLPAITG